MDPIRITNVTITPVAFADPPLLNSVGVHEPFALRAVIEVATDAGLTGLGETYADEQHLAALHAAAQAIEGADVYHTEEIYRPDAAIAPPETTIASGTHRAQRGGRPGVLPLRGRLPGHPGEGGRAPGRRPARRRRPGRGAVLRLPVLQVGGSPRCRTRDDWGEALDPDGIVAQAKRMIDEYGFTAIKLKGGVFPPDAGDRGDPGAARRLPRPSAAARPERGVDSRHVAQGRPRA